VETVGVLATDSGEAGDGEPASGPRTDREDVLGLKEAVGVHARGNERHRL
jgi:hypothetical protein